MLFFKVIVPRVTGPDHTRHVDPPGINGSTSFESWNIPGKLLTEKITFSLIPEILY